MNSTNLKFDVKDEDYLVWQGKIVMSRSEEPYFEELFKRVAMSVRSTRVLEIGFGLGISALLIQRHLCPEEHHIVELDSGVFSDLVRFADQCSGVFPILGDWRLTKLAAPYDFLFYDPFDYFGEGDSGADLEAHLLCELLGPSGVLCHPHFGDGPPRPLHGFRDVVLARLEVPPIAMADGSSCDRAAVVLCYPIDKWPRITGC